MDRFELGNQFGLEFAGLLGVEVTHLLGDINKRGNGLVMALFRSLFISTSSSADLDRELLAGSVSDKLAGLLLNVLGGTRGLIHSPALLRALAVAHLLHRLVALLHGLVEGLLLEGDLTGLLKVLLAHLLLGRGELGDVGVVALLHVLVGALKDGVLLEGGHLLQFIYAAEVSGGVSDTVTEVHSTSDSNLTPSTGYLVTTSPSLTNKVGRDGGCQQTHSNYQLKYAMDYLSRKKINKKKLGYKRNRFH